MSTADGYSWGGWSGYFRLGLWSGISGTTVTMVAYGQSDGFGHDWSSTLYFTGGPAGWARSTGVSFYSPYNTSITKEFGRWSYSYVGTQNFGLNISYFNGSASVSRAVTIDNPLPAAPAAPSVPTVTRLTTGKGVVLAWTHGSGGGARASYRVMRENASGTGQGWFTIADGLSASATSFTDTTVADTNAYKWKIVAVNAGGTGNGPETPLFFYWTASTPTAPTVARTANSVTVSWTGAALGVEITRSIGGVDTVVATLGSGTAQAPNSWVDTAPPTGIFTYRLRFFAGAVGVWRGWSLPGPDSAQVVTIAPPNAASNLSPNGTVVASDVPVPLGWQHNPVDGSAQTAAVVQYRKVGATTWTTASASTAQQVLVSLAAGSWEWQVQTKGAHATVGPWSAVATFTVIDRPTVNVNSPAGTVNRPEVSAAWGFFQAQGRPQSAWRAELWDRATSQVVESLGGSGATVSAAFQTRAENGGSYRLRAQVAVGDIWSAWAESAFAVSFIPPAPPRLQVSWDEDRGAHVILIEPGP